MSLSTVVILALLSGAPAAPQTPPIFNPGAPGEASREITAAEAVALSRTGFVEADVRFMQHMIVHHAQAVEMVALMETRAASETVRRMGDRIAQSQAAEMALMEEWLTGRGLPIAAADPHAGHHGPGHGAADPNLPLMPGMLSPARMAALAAATGPAFDRLFLEGMIQHHQGALGMVEALLDDPEAAEDPMLSDFASSVTADQSAEILRMQSILSEL
ncbi:MAG: DUF305 domain-containing protein [Brevundimonas sp.]|uniref:DUF305 domain-containing protein n=1 Tax=Brevundimonas sp. TaxID=1871086 RepID=UPI002607A453|nr:DUF305 domain-containing protein [Brevundimonas sp.]MDI6624921.1 DUF305 domain-containing protein [Brevundimonas sp.]MDQ7811371.1 DUF305 domain-containing protein [Brevundimonas sp.]